MEISCEHVWREVSNYLDGDVDPRLRAVLEEHVRGCKHCAAVLDGTRNVMQLFGDDRVLEVPLGFDRRLRQKLEGHMPSPRKNYFGWIALATAAVLLVGVFTIGGASAFRAPQLRSEHAQPATGVPPELMVVVAADGKTFHVAGCRFLHDTKTLRTIPASEALREGYGPCVRCMKEYLGAGLSHPGSTSPTLRASLPSR
jgi:hypothetical protein